MQIVTPPIIIDPHLFIGNTPRQKVGRRGSKANTHCISSRVIGVEVHCGPVHGTILYYTDDMSRGGSSTIVEVTRQGMVIGLLVVYVSICYYLLLLLRCVFASNIGPTAASVSQH